MNAELKEQIAQAEKLADEAAKEWLEKNKPILGELIKEKLDKRVDMIAACLLGFNNNWGKWELDHCNGRMGESAAGDWLRETAGDAVRAWLTDQAGNLPKLPKTIVESLRSQYLDVFRQELAAQLRKKAIRDASEALTQIRLDTQ
tara:strand:+ start:231 stop:665 length:435 start_codon:yes stop_codon:yes gene_type:complete